MKTKFNHLVCAYNNQISKPPSSKTSCNSISNIGEIQSYDFNYCFFYAGCPPSNFIIIRSSAFWIVHQTSVTYDLIFLLSSFTLLQLIRCFDTCYLNSWTHTWKCARCKTFGKVSGKMIYFLRFQQWKIMFCLRCVFFNTVTVLFV